MLQVELNDAVILFPVNEINDGAPGHFMGGAEKSILDQLADARFAALIRTDQPDQASFGDVIETNFAEFEKEEQKITLLWSDVEF